MKIIVADSGPLIIFARSVGLELLRAVVDDEVLVPSAVVAECVFDLRDPGAAAIAAALKSGILTENSEINPASVLPSALDDGEAMAIALAKKRRLPLLMDERLGRLLAIRQKIEVYGSAKILVLAKDKGLLSEVVPILEGWKDIGYFVSDRVIDEAARMAGEGRRPKP